MRLPLPTTPAPRPPRVLLVTGASSGIGRAVALHAARDGDHLVLAAREAASLAIVAGLCEAAGAASALVVPTDVGDDDAVADCLARTVEEHGRLDAVIHCAGVVAYGRVDTMPVEVFDKVLRTNLNGSVNVARHTLRILRKQERGSLILFGSVIGHLAAPGMTPYAVSKWGVRALARQLQLENRDLPEVHVGYVAPGGVDTPIYEQAANFTGWAGKAPPPVDRPEKVARETLALLDAPRKRLQVGLANGVMRFGFSALPWVYDQVIGPVFALAAQDRTEPLVPTTGNVLEPRAELHDVHGGQQGAPGRIVRQVLFQARSLAGVGG
jgi:NAD(P)-dependent dehydrogenase (short-subunit alcohol dehydrogenase family)